VPESVKAEGRRLPYSPGLDGLRGLAVAAVVVFHAGAPAWLPGGFLGVSLFFTLSGYLIASMVLAEVANHGGVSLRGFWSRRARRLVPALLVAAVGITLMALTVEVPDSTRRDLIGGLTYSANWVQIAGGQSYGDLFRAPSPAVHLWSLAIEEQFYLVFPLAVWLVARRWPNRTRTALGLGSCVVVIGGFAWAWSVNDGTVSYYSTFTRSPEIAIGVLLAVLTRSSRSATLRPSWWSEIAGVTALVVTAVAWRWSHVTDPWVVRGGLVGFAFVSAALVVTAVRPGVFGRALGVAPLRMLGQVSYGLYLFHWPVVVLLSRPRVMWSPGPLFVVRVALSLVLTVLSYRLIEVPVRNGRPSPLAEPGTAIWAGVGSLAIATLAVLLIIPKPVPDTGPDQVAAPALLDPATAATATTVGDGSGTTAGPGTPSSTTMPGPPVVALFGDSVPNWLIRQGAAGLDPDRVRLIDGTVEGCDGAEGSPVGRAGTGVVVSVPADCTGWRTQYPPVMDAVPVDSAILMVGAGAVLDRQLDGGFHGPCDPVARRWYRADLAARLEYLGDHADRVVVVLPAWAEDWSGWVNPTDHRARTDCVRASLEAAVAEAGPAGSDGKAGTGEVGTAKVDVVDLGAELCPDGPRDCRPVRSRDGVHIDPDQAEPILRWVVDQALP